MAMIGSALIVIIGQALAFTPSTSISIQAIV